MKKNLKTSEFIGRQLSRLKAGTTYYVLVMSTMTAVGVLKWALPEIDIWTIIGFCFVILIGAYFVGYLMDIWNVVAIDYRKTVEMSHRYLNIADKKVNEFNLLQTETLGEWLKALQEEKPIDLNILKVKYKKFVIDWSPKRENNENSSN